jgi:hypothetical protein
VPPPPEPSVERTVSHDDHVIQRALDVLAQALNPIRIAREDEIRVLYGYTDGTSRLPPGLNAFRAPGDTADPNIYVYDASAVYARAARKPSALNVLKLAGTLIHEQVHNTDGEFAACRLQADFVRATLPILPRRQRESGRQFLASLDARAEALDRAERRARQVRGR